VTLDERPSLLVVVEPPVTLSGANTTTFYVLFGCPSTPTGQVTLV
jgi:hypothetical protein